MDKELKIKSLIADKEITAKANSDLGKFGECQCNYEEWYREVSKELDDLMYSSKSLKCERAEARKFAEDLRELVNWDETEPWDFPWESQSTLDKIDEYDIFDIANELHSAFHTMKHDWKNGDFVLPKLAEIHISSLDKHMLKIGKILLKHGY